MKAMRAAGTSFQAIADRLTGQGVATKRGAAAWSAMTVKKVVERA